MLEPHTHTSPMNTLLRIFLLVLLTHQVSPAAEPVTKTEEFSIKYLDVTTAYDLLRTKFPEAPAIARTIEIDKNSLFLNASDSRIEQARAYLASIDIRPSRTVLQMVVSESDAAGNEKIISRPTVYAIDGKPAEITWGEKDGTKTKLTITARTVKDVAAK